MLLSELTIKNVGPFSEPAKIAFEPDITVLTGANDTGKSSILSAIELVCGMKGNARVLQESDVNIDRIGAAITGWRKDSEITCEAIFETTAFSKPHVGKMASGGELKMTCLLAPELRQMSGLCLRQAKGEGAWSFSGSVQIAKFPAIIRLPLIDQIRTVVSLSQPNTAELAFLQASFGPQFNHAKYAALSSSVYYNVLSKAKADANAKLKQFLPSSLVLEFDFVQIGDKREQISIQLRDKHEGHSPLGVRGTGIGRLIGLMASLLSANLDDQHYMILVDEPENSLHADAQHTLRSVLEELASKPNIQVVYATHSPSMINPIRTGSIRLLSRANNGRVAHTVVNNRPIDENFLSIRSSLGITPADSLLYAPVTLVVEGPSEVLGLPVIIGRLWKDGVEGFKDAGPLLSHVHFLDGQGDSYEQLCKLALSQGAKPIVFLDGDKSPRVAKTKKRFPDVPVILLDGNSEFEEIVPKEHYFNSLQTVMNDVFEESAGHLTVEHFDTWELCNKPHPKKAFSKRVEDWVLATTGFEFVKPLVMKHALSTVPLDEVNLKPLKELMFQIRNQL